MKTLKESLENVFTMMLDIHSGTLSAGIPTGYSNLDELLRGMEKGKVTILTSRPSLGKTAFALNVVKNLSVRTPAVRILFCSDLSHTELTRSLLTLNTPLENRLETVSPEEMKYLAASVEKIRDYPLSFQEHSGVDEKFCTGLRKLHPEHPFDLLIADNIRPEGCRKLKILAGELGIAVLALISTYSRKDELLCRGIADTLITLHRPRKVLADPDLGAPAELLITKNDHGFCGSCRMYFVPQVMLFKESCTGDNPFVILPANYESITPYTELKKYLSPDNLPLLEHLHSEIPQRDENTDPDHLLRLSARLEAVGDHENAVKVFKIGQKQCEHNEEKIECVYDLLHAAMYYWLYRRTYDMHSCMARAEQMLDEHSQREYDELKRRILTYTPANWIKEEDLEDPANKKKRFSVKEI